MDIKLVGESYEWKETYKNYDIQRYCNGVRNKRSDAGNMSLHMPMAFNEKCGYSWS